MEKTSQFKDSKLWKILCYLDDNFEKYFLVAGLFASFTLLTVQVIYRYVIVKMGMSASISWVEELARFLFIWISYLAVPIAIKKDSMVKIDIIYGKLSDKMKATNNLVVDILMAVMAGILYYEGTGMISGQLVNPTLTAGLKIPYMIPYLILPVGFGLTVLRIVQDFIKRIRTCSIVQVIIAIAVVAVVFLPAILNMELPVALWMFGYFLVFVLLSVPIAFSLGLAAVMTILGTGVLPMAYTANIAFNGINSVPIMAIPFFIVAGNLMGAGGLSRRLLAVADELVGRFPGGLALATIATCVVFAAMSGSGPATVAAIGGLTIPTMIEKGYDKKFAAVIVACAGAIGVLIPPSNPFVIYAISSGTSIGKVFMAGIVPGLLVAAALAIITVILAIKNGWKGESRAFSMKRFAHQMWDAKWAMLVPVLILGGIYCGIFTPTEAAAVAAFYGLIVGVFIYKEISIRELYDCFVDSCVTSSTVIVLMGMAAILCNIMTLQRIPVMVAEFITSISNNKIVILMLINVMLLITGTFMEAAAAIVVLVPILLPVVKLLGVDPVHFGIIMTLNLAIGFLTPPVGVNLFVASGLIKTPIKDMVKTLMLPLAAMIVVLLLVTYVPAFSLWLPSMMK
ncbi:MAG: TRAP transporter large permease subunit [Brotaphodocola sp.]